MNDSKYYIGICKKSRADKDCYKIIVKDSIIKAEELVDKCLHESEEHLDLSMINSDYCHGFGFELCNITFYRANAEDAPQLKELFDMKEKVPILLEEISRLKDNVEKLKARNLFLEHEPYRGPEFYKILEEEKNNGMCFNPL